MYHVPPEMTDEEWEMYDGGFPYIDPEALEQKRKQTVSKERCCPTCMVGWKSDQDGETCWSCGIQGDIGVAK